MPSIDLSSPIQLKKMLAEYGFHTKKRFGQNFLTDRNIVNKIVDSLDLSPDDCVMEIGPGAGTLTQAISAKCKKIAAIEIDRDLIDILRHTLSDYCNIDIINSDILKINLNEFIPDNFESAKIKVAGNLPYYITSPIISHLFDAKCRISSISLMVQKEVADRLVSKPGSKEYGSLSIYVQYHSKVEIVAQVSKNVFMPSPEVSSAIISIKPYENPKFHIDNKKLFFTIVHCAFGKRRKTLLNSLSDTELGFDKNQIFKILDEVGIDHSRRAETLSIEDFISITQSAERVLNNKT